LSVASATGPKPAWDTREGEEFSEWPKFLNYVQHIFPGGEKMFLGGIPPLVTGLISCNLKWTSYIFVFVQF